MGLGSAAFLPGVGIEISSSNNVILQNLKVTLVGATTPGNVNGGDAIVINGTSNNVWIDHCEIAPGQRAAPPTFPTTTPPPSRTRAT